MELCECQAGGGQGPVAAEGVGQDGEGLVGGGFGVGLVADPVADDGGEGEQFGGLVEGDPAGTGQVQVRLAERGGGEVEGAQRMAVLAKVGVGDGSAGVREARVQRAAAGDGGRFRGVAGGEGFGVVALRVGGPGALVDSVW
ncbi:hypothetical protein [Streptomyces sp. NPDC058084]|uniref:hypothetical protein n=1 Tax=Streptomyces sp. NPDC058084 TaxID=3346333 RepID=UPI0036EDC7AC